MRRPVTQTLIEQLRRAVVHHMIVVWLDRDGHYTGFVDALAKDGPERVGAPVLAYRGSYLELLRQLAPLTDGVDPAPLLVHVPGANQESIKKTPLLELNDTGYQFRKALGTLIREAAAGRVTPNEVDAFLAAGDVTIESADAWMAQRVAAADDATEILLRGTDPGRLIEDLISKGPIHRELGRDQLPAVWHYLATQTGLPEAWPTAEQRRWAREVINPPTDAVSEAPPNAEKAALDAETAVIEGKRRLADLGAAWALCVEYVHDLKRAPKAELLGPASSLARPLIQACRAAAEHLRGAATKYYVTLADDVEDQIDLERKYGAPDELGRIDTFRFEEDRLLVAALAAVKSRSWVQAKEWAAQRLAGKSVWLELDPARRKTWELIEKMVRLGTAIKNSTLSFSDARNLGEATRQYAEHGAAIDRLHREFEQQAERDLLFDSLPHVERVRLAVTATRATWREWAEDCAQQWNSLCEQEGALPNAGLQQRMVYEQVIEPLLDDRTRTALFLVDAMRYEMAQQLVSLIGSPAATSIHLSPRLAELPSITEIGMNAIVPSVHRGTLHPLLDSKRRRIQGFDAGGFQVKSRTHRETLLARRAGGVKWFEIEDVLATDASIGRQVAKARLVVVHSIQIDKAGEAGNGLVVFPGELRRIHKAWQRLRAAGIRRFVFTSDHGFLLRNIGDKVTTHGQRYEALPRYAVYPKAVTNSRQLGISLRSLGYEGANEALEVPRGLAVYQSGRDRKFVHGGNSPQERVIPVLTMVHKQAVGGEDQHYRVELLEEVGGQNSHELRARVVRADNQTTLALDVEPIEIELRAAGSSGVVAETIECEGATLDSGLITARVGREFHLRFRLSSVKEQRVRVELFGASAKRRVDSARSDARFTSLTPGVSGAFRVVEASQQSATPEIVAAPANAVAWLEEFKDVDVRRVMSHIDAHGEVTESDLVGLLGNARKARRFARNFEKYRAQAPFLMEAAPGPSGRVYRKVSDK